jgi:hypothetical protein
MDAQLTSGDAGLRDETPESTTELNPYDWPTFTLPNQD